MSSAEEHNARLAGALRGQTMQVPNLLELFPNWPSGGRNKYYKRLQQIFNDILERVIPDEKRRLGFIKSDFALFCSIWYPEADWENFHTCGLFTLGIFIFDDTIDTNEHVLAHNFEDACRFRERTLTYIRYCLGLKAVVTSSWSPWMLARGFLEIVLPALGLSGQEETGREPLCPSKASGIFEEFGERACRVLTRAQRERFCNELEYFFNHSEMEQAERLSGHIPDYEGYMSLRLGTTAYRVFACLSEIALETNLPGWIIESPDMQALWKETNVCIIMYGISDDQLRFIPDFSSINDILSLKKELATDCVINLVPVMSSDNQSLDAIVGKLLAELTSSRHRFDKIGKDIDQKLRYNLDVHRRLMKYIDGCRTSSTGTIEYSILAARYGINESLQEDGSLCIVL